MVHYNNFALKQPVCPTCSPFTIHGANQLATKLVDLDTLIRAVRPQWIPSHQEYVALVQGLSFVVLAQPISTRCTITGDVHAKVMGKPETSSSKVKVGQGDYKSIIFWTNEQSKVMMWDQQFVVFTSPWSTGKTICQREKARIWATDNSSQKLYFCVVRGSGTKNPTLLELDLKDYFQEHNVQNVTVLGIPSNPKETMSELFKKMSSMPAGSWMVDELCMPNPKDHTKWAAVLQNMRNHMLGQPGHLVLWISIAGIVYGKPDNFKHTHLAPLMPGFHLPVMEFPLRNTKEVIKLAGLDSKDTNKTVYVASSRTNPCYSLPPNLMCGVLCQEIKVKKNNDAELSKAVETGCVIMLDRTAGSGFPVLADFSKPVSRSSVVAAVQRILGTTLLYTNYGSKENEATEAEVEEWVRRWKRGEERRALITDQWISRGWEASAVLAIGSSQTENLVMRTCGFCFLIKIE